MKVKDIVAAIERTAPLGFQDDWDNSGLQVGFPEADVDKVLVCLDVTEAIVEEAARLGFSTAILPKSSLRADLGARGMRLVGPEGEFPLETDEKTGRQGQQEPRKHVEFAHIH